MKIVRAIPVKINFEGIQKLDYMRDHDTPASLKARVEARL